MTTTTTDTARTDLDIREGDRVHGGTPGTEDYDEGTVLEIDQWGARALVAWDGAAVKMWAPTEDLATP